jgi:hypothetical protein
MPIQGSSAANVNTLDAGNAIIYVAPVQASLSAAIASSAWKKIGLTSAQTTFDLATQKLAFNSGTPLVRVADVIVSSAINLTGNISEFNPLVLSQILGGPTPVVTLKSSTPAATTVASSPTPTASTFTVASITDYKVGMFIQVGTGSSAQYGYIQSIAGSAITIVGGLSGNTAPASSAAVAAVASYQIPLGGLASTVPLSFKISKNIITNESASIDFYIMKGNPSGNLQYSFSDDQDVSKLAIPFAIEGLSDPNIENGRLGFSIFNF